jgi:ribosomal protein S18 acetylase RimI-like enzyme
MLHIRVAGRADAANLFMLNQFFNGKDSTTIDLLDKSLKTNEQELVCIAYDGNEAIGFVCGQLFKSMCYSEYYAEITELFVKEEYRRQGIARKLISYMESIYIRQGIRNFQLFTGKENLTAQEFYKKSGYNKTDEIMYRKRLKKEQE